MDCLTVCLAQGIEQDLCKAFCRNQVADSAITPILVALHGPSLPNLFVGISPSLQGSVLDTIPASGALTRLLASTGTRSILVSRSSTIDDLVAVIPFTLTADAQADTVTLRVDPVIPKSNTYSVSVTALPPLTQPTSKLLTCPFAIGIKPSASWSTPAGEVTQGFPSWKWLALGLGLGLTLVLLAVCVTGYIHCRRDLSAPLHAFKKSLLTPTH